MKVIEKIVDIQTGEEIVNERDETAQEKIEREADELKAIEREAEAKALEAEAKANATAKTALLAKLGITAEEARILLS
jgi:hypothetical protein